MIHYLVQGSLLLRLGERSGSNQLLELARGLVDQTGTKQKARLSVKAHLLQTAELLIIRKLPRKQRLSRLFCSNQSLDLLTQHHQGACQLLTN
jgi:hypothetical protein